MIVNILFYGGLALMAFAVYMIIRGDTLPSDPEKRADELERRWLHQRWAEGASMDEIWEEKDLRMALARMRREATSATLHNPKDYEKIIEEAKTEQADYLLTCSGKAVALKFLHIAQGLKLPDILYPDAYAAVSKSEGWDKPWTGTLPTHHHEDRTAAFTDL